MRVLTLGEAIYGDRIVKVSSEHHRKAVPTGSLPSVTLTITGFSISVILPLQERSTNVTMQQVP